MNSFINSSQFNKKRTQLNICKDLLQWAEADKNYIKFIIMGKKTWVYRYYTTPKSLSSSRLKKSVTEQIKCKNNALCFWMSRFGALQVCSKRSNSASRILCESLISSIRYSAQKWPELWLEHSWFHQPWQCSCTYALCPEISCVKQNPSGSSDTQSTALISLQQCFLFPKLQVS